MADGRILHRSAGDSAKVSALSDFEYRVWTQYILSADDFGVMPAEAVKLQADNRALRNRPRAKVQAALETTIAVGLVSTFEHQGQRYAWQPDWNDRQDIRYPRNSVNPLPPLGEATESTRNLFNKKKKVSEESPTPVRAGVRETQTPTQALTPTPTRPIIDGQNQRAHGSHAWCDLERGLCVPTNGLHEEFQRRGLKTDAELRAWYPTIVAAFAGQPVGNDLFEFWRGNFARWVGTVAVSPASPRQSKTQESIDAGRKILDEIGAKR